MDQTATMVIIGWVAWCTLHSLLIAPPVRGWLRRRLGRRDRGFRLGYNAVAALTLLPLLVAGHHLHGPEVWRWGGPWVGVRLLLAVLVVWLLRAGARQYDLRRFLGLAQLRDGRHQTTLSAGGGLDPSGVLGVTRHPWYLAGLLFVWIDAAVIDVPGLIINAILTVYLVLGTMLEERKLVGEFGDDYRRYQQQVSMLVPWRWAVERLTSR
jgi:protein-S-isoprenylcysteine O-methyltransferase Ste14